MAICISIAERDWSGLPRGAGERQLWARINRRQREVRRSLNSDGKNELIQMKSLKHGGLNKRKRKEKCKLRKRRRF